MSVEQAPTDIGCVRADYAVFLDGISEFSNNIERFREIGAISTRALFEATFEVPDDAAILVSLKDEKLAFRGVMIDDSEPRAFGWLTKQIFDGDNPLIAREITARIGNTPTDSKITFLSKHQGGKQVVYEVGHSPEVFNQHAINLVLDTDDRASEQLACLERGRVTGSPTAQDTARMGAAMDASLKRSE